MERSDHHSADAVGAGFGDEAIEEGGRRKREEGFAVDASAGGAGGAVPVVELEGVLSLSPGFRVACEEPLEQGVGFKGERVDGELPNEASGQQVRVTADQRAADSDRAGHVSSGRAGKVVDALRDQLRAGGVEKQRVAPSVPLEESEAHGALLEECGRGAPLAEGRERGDTVDRSSSREAASKARTPPSVSRRTWCCMSSESGMRLNRRKLAAVGSGAVHSSGISECAVVRK
jgi:hypothetical protein